MKKTIIFHELKNIILTPKFYSSFLVITILILLSVFLGIRNYQDSVKQYETVTKLSNQEMRERSDWMGLSAKMHRKPDPMQIFASGVNDDIGRYSNVNSFNPVKLIHSNYSDNPVYAIFRFIDFAFIVTIILSLFVIIFTYDAINGEKERGTLQLVLSNAVPRKDYIIGKITGIWLGLIVPLFIPVLLGILLVLLYRIPFTADTWLRLVLLLSASFLLYTFFIVLGILSSTLTLRSSTSFLISLSAWIIFVFIIPRAGIMTAAQIIRVPGFAEIQGRESSFEKQRWEKNMNDAQERWKLRNADIEKQPEEVRSSMRDQKMWEWMEEEDKERKQVQIDVDNYNVKLTEDFRNSKLQQEKLGFTLSSFSPVSAFQLCAMNIAGTDINLKNRYEDLLTKYRTVFNDYKEQKQKESKSPGGIRITMDSEKGLKIETSREKGTLDLSGLPIFHDYSYSFRQAFSSSVISGGILIFFILICTGASVWRFMRFDVR
jgi:ABC-type transport system involved in multi-copper enzyme maturation permease subunit